MLDLFSLKGQIAVVTGASRGLGRDFAQTLADAGATVVCIARTADALQVAVEGIHARGGGAEALVLDITDEAAVAQAIGAIVARHDRIDVLVNNAGILYRKAVVETATEDWRAVIETDLTAPFLLARNVARHMLARRYGRIVNIASVMGILGRTTVGGYVAAKHGLIGLTKTLAAELGPDVTVNCLSPGYIRTEINVALQQNREFSTMIEGRTAARRWGTPADLRAALLLLAGPGGGYITGHSLVVDGGLTSILA